MDDLSVNVRLRPIRFGFMVSPEDGASLRRIFQINTCLWGGVFNPIIPVIRQVPAWWERQGIKFESAKQIVNGYLDYFEPDFIVEAKKDIATGYGIDAERILQLADILPRSNQGQLSGYGQSVLDLYKKLYREEFQFVRRHKQKIIAAKAVSRGFDGFVASAFGAFPVQDDLRYFAKAFMDVFEPQQIKIDGAQLANLYGSQFLSALRVGGRGLEVNHHDYSNPTLFIMNARQPRDLLDYWNYRAVHRSCIPVPVQWLPELASFCKEFILSNHRPLPGNQNGVMTHTTCMFSRSIPEANIEGLHADYLRVDQFGANVIQTWYPPIWQPAPEYVVRRTRPSVTASEKNFTVPLDIEKPNIRFESLSPDFTSQFGGEARWANVIRLRDWSHKDRIATVVPTDFKVQALPSLRLTIDHLLSTTEGLVDFQKYKDGTHYWRLTDGKKAIEAWLKADGISCALSESGRATHQIIQTLGGFSNVRSIAHKTILNLLDGMARRPITRSAHHRKFENEINLVEKGDTWRHGTLKTLVEQKAVELGQELKCSKCGHWSW